MLHHVGACVRSWLALSPGGRPGTQPFSSASPSGMTCRSSSPRNLIRMQSGMWYLAMPGTTVTFGPAPADGLAESPAPVLAARDLPAAAWPGESWSAGVLALCAWASVVGASWPEAGAVSVGLLAAGLLAVAPLAIGRLASGLLGAAASASPSPLVRGLADLAVGGSVLVGDSCLRVEGVKKPGLGGDEVPDGGASSAAGRAGPASRCGPSAGPAGRRFRGSSQFGVCTPGGPAAASGERSHWRRCLL